ncbi:hypothetical protein B0T14DRAFT_494209 [Immersiella caudata]|uniref:Uncharacterized protein n=1 Tax=Immersiella caudata TaxID=314043 RepID=A0AA39WW07_9PEZI|nr:hypothetical protein B0T14DRAFT_494209 [Immersiella caudata]
MSSSKAHRDRHSSSRSHKISKSSSGGSSSRASGHKSSKSSETQSGVSCKVSIKVEPPVMATFSTPLYPSIVAKAKFHGLPSDQVCYTYAHAVLVDAAGQTLDNQLGNNVVATGVFLEETSYTGGSGGGGSGSGSGSGSSNRKGSTELYYIFPHLQVPILGDFLIRIDVHHCLLVHNGSSLMGQAETRNITVVEEVCAQEWGSQEERWILQCFRNQGENVPQEPQPH